MITTTTRKKKKLASQNCVLIGKFFFLNGKKARTFEMVVLSVTFHRPLSEKWSQQHVT